MQDEKILEATVEALLGRVQDLKNSCQSFLFKLEQQQMSWPQMLDNFAVISGQVSTLIKVIKNERTPTLRNLVVLPLLVQQDQDPELQRATEGRISAFNHEVVPDHLRTKYEPDVEDNEKILSATAAKIPPELAQNQISSLNKTLQNLIETVGSAREKWETDVANGPNTNANINVDLTKLVGAVTFGKGLSGSGSHKLPSQARHGVSQRQSPGSGKVTSAIKTELKNKITNGSNPYVIK